MHSSFNPFDKPTHEKLSEDDLQSLVTREVSEGYYVEFKSTFPANEKIGKSLASLANAYGGWYIVGVEDNSANTAIAVPGFSIDEFKNPIARIQRAVKEYIEPMPVIFPQLVELSNGRHVLAVYVPGEQDTPFICRNGVIYRRNHESSDPVPENSRHTVDRLYQASKERAEEFARFCKDERTHSQAEKEQGWLHVYVQPEPFGVVDSYSGIVNGRLSELIKKASENTIWLRNENGEAIWSGNVPLYYGYSTVDSVVLQQQDWFHPFNGMELQMFSNGRAKLSLPLDYIEPKLFNGLESENARSVLRKVVNDSGDNARLIRFFDIQKTCTAVIGLLAYYNDWLGEQPFVSDMKVALKASNVWRHVPFVDHDSWAEHESKFGVCIVRQNEILYPRAAGKGFRLKVDDEGMGWWNTVAGFISVAFGLPPGLVTHAMIDKASKHPVRDAGD